MQQFLCSGSSCGHIYVTSTVSLCSLIYSAKDNCEKDLYYAKDYAKEEYEKHSYCGKASMTAQD